MNDMQSGGGAASHRIAWRALAAVLVLATVACAGVWLCWRRDAEAPPAPPPAPAPVAPGTPAVAMRDLKSGVAVRPGSQEDTPELVVDPFPDDPLPPGARDAWNAQLNATGYPMDGPVVGKEIRPEAGWEKPTEKLFRVDGRGDVANVAELGKYLYGAQRPDLRNPPTFLVKASGPCRLNVRIGRVNKRGAAEIEFVIDDLKIPMLDLHAARDTEGRVGRILDLEIPAGEHRVTVRNTGRDWVAVDWYRFSGHLSD